VNMVCPCIMYEPHWMVRNLYLPDASHIADFQYITVEFDLSELGISPGMLADAIGYKCFLTDTALLEMPLPVDYDWGLPDTFSDDAEGIEEPDTIPGPSDDEPYPEFVAGDSMETVEYRGCRMKNIDLDDHNHPDTYTYAGDSKACGPASAANSLKWLDDVSPDVTITDDIRTVMEELSGYMMRARNRGVTTENFIRGKLDYIQAKGLNINVKFQSYYIPLDSGDISAHSGPSVARNRGDSENRYPTWEWLKSEVQDSEDVEILYHGRKASGRRWGHAAVVSGLEETGSGRGTVKVKHDRRQSRADSTRTIQEPLDIYTDSYGRMRIRGKRAAITGVVSESPGEPFVNVGETPVRPQKFDIDVRPNPFNSAVSIEAPDHAIIEINDITGRCIARLSGGKCVWRPEASAGSGVYLVRVKTGDTKISKRVIYLK